MRKQLIGSLFALAVAGQLWGQGLYEKYERMLTLPMYAIVWMEKLK